MTKVKRKMPKFYKVLIILVVFGILFTGIVLNFVWDYLSVYERNLPKYVARDVFAEYFESGDYSRLYSLYSERLGPYEGEAEFEKYLNTLIGGGTLTDYEITVADQSIRCFGLKSAGKKLATLFLKKSAKDPGWGQTLWEFDRIELEDFPTASVKVRTVSDSTLLINGREVARNSVIESGIETESCAFMPEGVDGLTFTVYQIDGLITEPEIACLNKYGDLAIPAYDMGTEMFIETVTYDERLASEYTDLAVEAQQTYQRYLTNDASSSDVRKYFDADSVFYKSLMHTSTVWYAAHIGHSYKDEAVGEFYSYGDKVFSCRYVGTQIITRTKTDIRYFDLDCVMYFRLVDGAWKVYSLDFKQD
ncbi:MAG: hypothetical protein IJV00_09030 [Clostridia bacterium]|nr:hypothetical protein [Clostridia bacterium]